MEEESSIETSFLLRHDSNDETGKFKLGTPFLWFSAIVIAISAMSLGYDAGCMNDSLSLIGQYYNLTSPSLEVIDGTFNIWGAFGALVGSIIADSNVGRKGCLGLGALSYLVGTLVATYSVTWVSFSPGVKLATLL